MRRRVDKVANEIEQNKENVNPNSKNIVVIKTTNSKKKEEVVAQPVSKEQPREKRENRVLRSRTSLHNNR